MKVSWKDEPEEHDHPAATAYLSPPILLIRGDENTDTPCRLA
jgi:hypothetical protein